MTSEKQEQIEEIANDLKNNLLKLTRTTDKEEKDYLLAVIDFDLAFLDTLIGRDNK